MRYLKLRIVRMNEFLLMNNEHFKIDIYANSHIIAYFSK